MTAIMMTRLNQITAVSASNGCDAWEVWLRSARDRSSVERTWPGTPINNDTPCIFPVNDICARGVETGR